jgi:hypothetical protein
MLDFALPLGKCIGYMQPNTAAKLNTRVVSQLSFQIAERPISTS